MRQTQTAALGDSIGLTEKFTFNPKEGIDNPAMSVAEDAEADWVPSLRLCTLKREEGENFGFYLRVERGCKGHVIRRVQAGGVAGRSGLRDGDRLLEVNEVFVDDLEHVEVARRIQMGGSLLCFLLLDGDEYNRAVSKGHDLRALAKAHRGEGWKAPRICHITKDPGSGSLGLTVQPVDGGKGKFIASPATGGAAEKAGVRKGDHLVWINGAMTSELTHSAISKMLKKSSDHMTVVVIDSEGEQSYARRRVPVLPAMAVAQTLPYRSRRLPLEEGEHGYGFSLREETVSGHVVQMLREVDAGSPAEHAGIRDGELLLEVNGESTASMSHEDIVNKIKQNGKRITLTTISKQGQDFYTKLGLSPLLFCEDYTAGKEVHKENTPPGEKNVTVEITVPPADLPEELHTPPSFPRLCVLQKGEAGFGFHLGCVPHCPGTSITQVAQVGPGKTAGLLQGDVVLEVNGQNVEEEYLEDVIVRVKEGGSSLSLLVVDRSGYEKLKKSRTPIKDESLVNDSEVEETENLTTL